MRARRKVVIELEKIVLEVKHLGAHFATQDGIQHPPALGAIPRILGNPSCDGLVFLKEAIRRFTTFSDDRMSISNFSKKWGKRG